ncbi:MAG TPA: PDZ domain-containing protein [Opitutaceae bacterium]|nr:PDZ domain-containing protein [Opitutaceae bacterium]
MKTPKIRRSILPFVLVSFCAAAALPAVTRAQQQSSAEPPPPPPAADTVGLHAGGGHAGRKFLIRHDDVAAPGEKETVTFLGVETSPVSPALTAQLNLQKGAGLVVTHVVPESPAAASLQAYDVLLKLDDQLLIEPRQFSVLVRNRQEGDQVTLTYLRGGKQATATVKLTKHEVPKVAFFRTFQDAPTTFSFSTGEPAELPPRDPVEMDHVLALVRRDDDGPGPGMPGKIVRGQRMRGNLGYRATNVNPGNSNMVFTDEKGSLDLTIKDGKKTLVAKNEKGEPIFSGPVTTPEERKAMPADLLKRLEQIEGMKEFSFEPGEDFHDNVKFLAPEHTKISFPHSAESDAAPDMIVREL